MANSSLSNPATYLIINRNKPATPLIHGLAIKFRSNIMIHRHPILGVLGFVVLSIATNAYANCDRNSDNTHAINACSEQDFNAADAKLNATYKRITAYLTAPKNQSDNTAEIKKYLLDAQRAWITFRDNDCLARDVAQGGGTSKVGYFSCMKRHADTRTKQLDDFHKELQEY